MQFRRGTLVALLLIGVAFQSPLAQEGPPPQVIRLTSEAVILDVVVRDKKGNLLADLSPEEFHVFENGKEQKIQRIRFVDGSQPHEDVGPAAPTRYMTSAPVSVLNQNHLVSLVFDSLDNEARRYAREAVKDLMNTDLPEDTYIGVFAIYHGLRALCPFTSDMDLVWEAVELATSGKFDEINNQSLELHQQLVEASRRLESLTSTPAAPVVTPGGGPVSTWAIARRSQQIAELAMFINILDSASAIQGAFQGHSVLDALQVLVSAQRDLPGRKSVVYFSEGLYIPEKLVYRLRNVISRSNISNVSVYSVDARGLSHDSQSRLGADALTHAAAMSRSQVQAGGTGPVSAAEVRSLETAENSIRMNVQVTLEDLSRSTGGFLIADTNDPSRAMQQLADELQSYYEIVYTPDSDSSDSSYRQISVKVDRPSVTVQSRDGYYPLPPDSTNIVKGYEVPLLARLEQPESDSEIPLYSRTLHYSGVEGAAEEVIAASVPADSLTFETDHVNSRYSGHASILALVKSSQGELIHKFSEDYLLEGPEADLAGLRQGNIIFNRSFEVPPGRYRIELVAYDHISQKGAARRQVLVAQPPREQIDISSIVLIGGLEPLSYADKLVESPLYLPNHRVIPQLESEVKPGAENTLAFHCIVYPSAAVPDKATLTVALFRDGQPLFKGQPDLAPAAVDGHLTGVFTIPTQDLPPGSYRLRAWAEQGGQSATESALFTLVK
ncbi:MAG: VWA domain-containing protein [Acidobacteriota bacterium]|nr:MAG: VWA domain-containing protein [Acidobacteriota bacterium]